MLPGPLPRRHGAMSGASPPSICPRPLRYLSDLVTTARPLCREAGGALQPPPSSHPFIAFLQWAEGTQSSMPGRGRSPWGGSWSCPGPASHPAAPLRSFLFPCESVEASASQTEQAGD